MVIDRDSIKILLILLIVGLGMGYAYINSDLNINGTAQVNSANWDVHWANVQVSTGSVSASSPTISNQTTVNYSVVLDQPGDYYEFTVDAVNGGSIDAMIDSIDSKLNGATIETLPDYLSYTVTYEDDMELEPNHLLAANSTETYKVKIKYRDDIELNQIPATNQNLSLELTVTYRQATDDAEDIEHIVTKYTANIYEGTLPNNNAVQIGQAIPNDITKYNSASEALAALREITNDNNIQYYLMHTVQGGIVTESYIEFIVTEEMFLENTEMIPGTYTLRGAGATFNSSTNEYNEDSPYYENNKMFLLDAFGTNNCTDYSYRLICAVPGWGAYAYKNGMVSARTDDSHPCRIESDGSSFCEAS